MTRREFLAASALATAGLMAGCGLRTLRNPKPRNLVLIISDTLRADHLTCNGFPANITPGVDDLARRGTIFTEVMSPAPLTGASHASVMTGAYQTVHGVVGNRGKIAAGVPTLAEILQASGWDTAAFISNPVVTPPYLAGIERGFGIYNAELPSMERNRPSAYRDAKDTTEAALAWLGQRNTDRFFLWVHYMEPHGPYEVPESEFLDRVQEMARAPEEPESLEILSGDYGQGGIPSYQVLEGEQDPLKYRRRYAARAAYVDGQISRLIRELRQMKVEDETLLVFTSDHGELLGEHDYYFQHGITLLQPVLCVPLIFAGPGVSEGRTVSAPIGLVDVMPSLLELFGLVSEELTEQMQGTSLLSTLSGAKPHSNGAYYAICERQKTWCVRRGRYKYTLGTKGRAARGLLTDLVADDTEEKDWSRELPDIARELRERLEAFTATAPDLLSGKRRNAPALSQEDRARLKALGYLD